MHFGEAERFEPPRGSWAHVSGRVPAVDDDGLARIEQTEGLGLDRGEGDVDGPREMVLLELVPGQDLDDLRAGVHERLHGTPIMDRVGHGGSFGRWATACSPDSYPRARSWRRPPICRSAPISISVSPAPASSP